MGKTCYYEMLGLTRTCSEVELKSAFRKAAMQFHPDRNPGDTACEVKFKEVNEAYQCLSDPQKRAAYDRFGHAAFEQGGGGNGFASDGFGASMSDIFDDLFGDVMGRRGRGNGGATRGSDLRYNLEITLEEAFAGKTANLTLPTSVACTACSGSGRQARCQAARLPDLRRLWTGAGAAGLLLDRAHLPALPRPGRGHRQSVHDLLGHRPGDARA